MSQPDANDELDPRDPEVVALLDAMHAADPDAFQFSSLAEARAKLPRRLKLRRGVNYEPPAVGDVIDIARAPVPCCS